MHGCLIQTASFHRHPALLSFFETTSFSVGEADEVVGVCVVLEGLTELEGSVIMNIQTLNGSAGCELTTHPVNTYDWVHWMHKMP
jgi:hypothetical protein